MFFLSVFWPCRVSFQLLLFFYQLAGFILLMLPLYSFTRCCTVICTLAYTCNLTCDLCFVPITWNKRALTKPLSLSAYRALPRLQVHFKCTKYGKKWFKNVSHSFAYGYFNLGGVCGRVVNTSNSRCRGLGFRSHLFHCFLRQGTLLHFLSLHPGV